jgi:hypothetical protein
MEFPGPRRRRESAGVVVTAADRTASDPRGSAVATRSIY